MLGLDPREVDVPVVGEHAGVTILPLLSQVQKNLFSNNYLLTNLSCNNILIQVKPPCSFTQKEIDHLTDRIQNGGTEVVEVKLIFF